MPDTQGFTPSSGEENASSPENAAAPSANAKAEAAAPNLSESSVAPETPKTGTFWVSYGLCVVGAIAAVMVGAALFGPDQSLISKFVFPLFSAIGAGLTIAMKATVAFMAVFPWALAFEVIAGFAVFYVCRMGKTRKVQNGLFISAVTGLIAFVVYLMVDSPEVDNMLAVTKAFSIYALVLGFAYATSAVRNVRHQSGDCAACTFTVLGIIAGLATLVMWAVWFSCSQDTYPDVTKVLEQKYGAQLESMGFEDVSRKDLSDSGFCSSVDYYFHSGVSISQTAPAPGGVFFLSSDYSEKTTCMSMRFREGHLTAIYPVANTHNSTTSAELKADAIKSADNLFAGIQTAYKNVQMEKARKAQGF